VKRRGGGIEHISPLGPFLFFFLFFCAYFAYWEFQWQIPNEDDHYRYLLSIFKFLLGTPQNALGKWEDENCLI